MAIRRKPKITEATATTEDTFIQGAPDAKPSAGSTAAPPVYEKGIPKGNKRQISLTISPELLRKVDETARRTGLTRAAIINMAIFRALEGEIFGGR